MRVGLYKVNHHLLEPRVNTESLACVLSFYRCRCPLIRSDGKGGKSMEALELVMKDDGLGYGDQIACCPKCGEPFCLPLSIAFAKSKPSTYPCNNCNQLIKLS